MRGSQACDERRERRHMTVRCVVGQRVVFERHDGIDVRFREASPQPRQSLTQKHDCDRGAELLSRDDRFERDRIEAALMLFGDDECHRRTWWQVSGRGGKERRRRAPRVSRCHRQRPLRMVNPVRTLRAAPSLRGHDGEIDRNVHGADAVADAHGDDETHARRGDVGAEPNSAPLRVRPPTSQLRLGSATPWSRPPRRTTYSETAVNPLSFVGNCRSNCQPNCVIVGCRSRFLSACSSLMMPSLKKVTPKRGPERSRV